MVPNPAASATKPPAIKDLTPTLLLTNHQLRRENAALHAHLQEQLAAFKASQEELVEEKRKLWEEVQGTRRRWEETCERVRVLEAAREKKEREREKEKDKEIGDMGCGSRESRATATSSTSTKTAPTIADEVVSASESVTTNIAIAQVPVLAQQATEATSQPEAPGPAGAAPATVTSTTPAPANETTAPPPPVYAAPPTTTTGTIPTPRSLSGRIKQGSLTLSEYVSMCAQLVRDVRAAASNGGSGEGQGEVAPGSAERELMVEFVRGMRVKAEKLRLVEELERGGWVAFERETRAVEFFCGWGVVEGVVGGWGVSWGGEDERE